MNHCDVLSRSSDAEAEYIGGGTGDAALLSGVAELVAETCGSCIH